MSVAVITSPDGTMNCLINAEYGFSADGQSVNAWIVGLLENAVAKAQGFAAPKMKAEEDATASRLYTGL